MGVNLDFKKRMNPNGEFYRIDESLCEFPARAAGLLKYKKQEWVMIAFGSEKRVDLIFVNKGIDRNNVALHLSAENIAKIATQEQHNSVLIFHNHPNTNPEYYDFTKPSTKDVDSANHYADILNQKGLSLLEFVCERGLHYEYFFSPADNFLPLSTFVNAVSGVNGYSKFRNLALHCERIF